MKHEVKVQILDRGFVVIDSEYYACNDGKELINYLSRIKVVAEMEDEQ